MEERGDVVVLHRLAVLRDLERAGHQARGLQTPQVHVQQRTARAVRCPRPHLRH
ncbi:hypothetical protein SLI_1133 [Streptomyces lividans 1326]|uniref:Uncharacterized protein n=1 Tax=Streptomyces lividans 1326 TaxID=1200984 RepID=A0A7U9H921_STRLI|nr:hypothetical protein SLI_1133 [Streptomyces lividans 1326]